GCTRGRCPNFDTSSPSRAFWPGCARSVNRAICGPRCWYGGRQAGLRGGGYGETTTARWPDDRPPAGLRGKRFADRLGLRLGLVSTADALLRRPLPGAAPGPAGSGGASAVRTSRRGGPSSRRASQLPGVPVGGRTGPANAATGAGLGLVFESGLEPLERPAHPAAGGLPGLALEPGAAWRLDAEPVRCAGAPHRPRGSAAIGLRATGTSGSAGPDAPQSDRRASWGAAGD